MGNGLLNIDILAGLHGPDGAEGVPVVRRGDGDGVDVLAFEQASDVFAGLDGDALVRPLLFLSTEDGVIDIAQAGDAGAFDAGETLEVITAASAEADDGDAHVVFGAGDLGPGLG